MAASSASRPILRPRSCRFGRDHQSRRWQAANRSAVGGTHRAAPHLAAHASPRRLWKRALFQGGSCPAWKQRRPRGARIAFCVHGRAHARSHGRADGRRYCVQIVHELLTIPIVKVLTRLPANHTMLIFYADGDGGVRTIVPQREQMCRATPAALQRLAPPLTMRPSHPCSHEVGQRPAIWGRHWEDSVFFETDACRLNRGGVESRE